MYNTNSTLKADYKPVIVTLPNCIANIAVISYQKSGVIAYDTPALLPKEEYCCNIATD